VAGNPSTPAAATQIRISESSINPNYGLQLGFYLNPSVAYNGVIQALNGSAAAGVLLLQPGGGIIGIGPGFAAGTVQPVAAMEIFGTNTASGGFANGDAVGATLYLHDIGTAAGNGGTVLFGWGGAGIAGAFAGIRGYVTNGTGPAGDIVFMTRGTSGNILERARFTSGGNLNIGSGTVVDTAFSIVAQAGIRSFSTLEGTGFALNAYFNGSVWVARQAGTGCFIQNTGSSNGVNNVIFWTFPYAAAGASMGGGVATMQFNTNTAGNPTYSYIYTYVPLAMQLQSGDVGYLGGKVPQFTLWAYMSANNTGVMWCFLGNDGVVRHCPMTFS
jgi:hypothetical protein